MYPTTQKKGHPAMHEFTTAVQAEVDEPEESTVGSVLQTKVDSRPVTLNPMTVSQMALAMYSVSNGRIQDNLAAIVNSFFAMLDDPEQEAHFKGRLFNRADKFDIYKVTEIVIWAMEQWGARPTPPSGDSSSSPESAGSSSTPTPQPEDSPQSSAFGLTVSST